MSNMMHYSVISEQEFLSMDFQTRAGLAKLTMTFWFLSQEPHSPGYLWDPYRTHHLQSEAFHWSRLLFHPHHGWTAGGSETLPASISSQSFGLSDEATCGNLTHKMNKTLEPHEAPPSTATEHPQGGFPGLPSPPRQHWPVQDLVASVGDDALGVMICSNQLVSKGLQDSNFLFLETRNHELELWFLKVKWWAVSWTEQAFLSSLNLYYWDPMKEVTLLQDCRVQLRTLFTCGF